MSDFLKKNGEFAEVKVYDSLADILRDVGLGRIKAGFGDCADPQVPALAEPGLQGEARARPTSRRWPAAWASACARPTPELLKKINASLAKLSANGRGGQDSGESGA